ncbi:amino acid ABC transporter ATP-binding protein [Pyrinomonas methylaliphatogenes]|uniref:ABC-type polar amino acid transport system, ATPase component n=1 Tax=Pyrinomonas methylaliphatogenes TaxID=454194 RepID=A0A0B6WW31_9BACT|nr:ATP-binding cassette domain-containing protein [Pyrinomonas methylaliphatogenes]MBX5478215.1 amino acid ABC transporter ATP-binding protein [Pyrinomonas methylaliphatogenes]CDM65301.1 ABC-type polar amino acid transport system, ATPase component [Pyrinomonas methylaliphatogenes]
MRVEGLRKKAGGRQILRGISFEVPSGATLGIIGASGSGKTTLLRCLNGLERIDDGFIECGEVRLEAGLSEEEYRRRAKLLRRRVGLVFQHLHLFPHLTVMENIVEAPIHVLGMKREEAERAARELLEEVELQGLADRYPESLSGGEQQRVAIVRALIMRPNVLLFDEPTSALDPRRSASVRALLRRFVAQGHTMIIVSHAIRFLEDLADQLLYMESGEVIEYDRATELLQDPKDSRTRDFLRQAI